MQTESILVIGMFEGHNIRQQWHGDEWYFSVVDVIAALTDSTEPSKYWTAMKARISDKIFAEAVADCIQLELVAADGKLRETGCASIGTLLKIIHIIPSLHRRERKPAKDDLKKSGIYAIVNSITGEQYIGSSRDVPSRFMQHRADLRRNSHSSVKLQVAWNLHGEDAFTFVLLENVLNESELELIEQIYVDAEKPVYNTDVTIKGVGLPVVEETRIQRFITFLRDQAGLSLKNACFQQLHQLIDQRILIPGPNFHRLTEAESAGITTWEALQAFLQN